MEVVINGVKAELGDSIPAISKASIDIDNPTSRFIDITNSFRLPDTLINRRIFNSPNGIGTNNLSFDVIYNVDITDAFKIFSGHGVLSSTSKDTFDFQVIDKSNTLFKALDVKLRDISYDDQDTELTTTEIDALDTIDVDSVWYWGKACYHDQPLKINTDQTTGNARCKYSRPAFYINALLKSAITNNGYTFTAPDIDLAFNSNHKDFFFTSYQKTIDDIFNITGTLLITDLTSNDHEIDVISSTNSLDIGTAKTAFRLRGSVSTAEDHYLIIRATDQGDATKVQEQKIFFNQDTTEINFLTNEIELGGGTDIEFELTGNGTVYLTDFLIYSVVSEKTKELQTNPFLGYKIKAYENLPDITYLDLFKTVCIVSNKYHIVDTLSKTFYWGTLSTLSKLGAKDWSDKFVIGSEKIDNKFGKLSQKNFLRYTNDVSVDIKLGEYSFDTYNENAQDEGDYIKLFWGASRDVVIDSNTIAHIPIYTDSFRKTENDFSIRLLNCDTDLLEFDSISWKNINDNYYASLFDSLYRVRVISCKMNLNKLDVLGWNEKDLVYVEYFNSVFLVLSIDNFIPNKLTTVKLLKYGRQGSYSKS